MNKHSDEWHKLRDEHLSMLTQWGREYTMAIEAGAILLQSAIAGEIEMSEEEKKEIITLLANTAKKHSELIKLTIREQQNFVDEQRNQDSSS